MQVVEFNLSGLPRQEFVLWKASASAPLLVYDPTNSGMVKEAKQLFGNFAFGGKTTSLSDFSAMGYRAPWTNGYEALELLDSNRDGVVSGKEMKDLKLWLDRNRDGVSDPGEVVGLSEFKITRLFYKNPSSATNSKDIELDIGYERMTDGIIATGRSVDWFTETFGSKAEASAAILGMFGGQGNGEKSSEIERSEIAYTNELYKGLSLNDKENLSGYWVWTILEKGAEKTPGFFVLSERVDDTISGYTVSEVRLARNNLQVRAAAAAIPGTGHITRADDKDASLSLVFRDSASGGVVESRATVSADGSVMKGTSTQRYQMKVGTKTKSAEVTYEWVATKMNRSGRISSGGGKTVN
jgi:hypothetical protein